MPRKKKPVVAICYDFDGTLSPKNMQEYKFIPQLSMTPKNFWAKAKKRAKDTKADPILAYMTLMLDSARSDRVQVSRSAIISCGNNVDLFPGVLEWFDKVNTIAKRDFNLKIQHYIISSGLKEMIEGSPIARKFTKIFASSFAYNADKVAEWPAVAVNFTTKTQFLFRINKGKFDIWDQDGVNEYVPDTERPVPFRRMIYIGDGATDIPCMKLVKDLGGHSIAVYKQNTRGAREKVKSLLDQNRVNLIAPADYSEGKDLERQVKAILAKIAADYETQIEIGKCATNRSHTNESTSDAEVDA